MNKINDISEGAGETLALKPKDNFEGRPHLDDTRRNLIAKRVAAGADSQIGHRCSNLIEQLDNLAKATGDQRVNLIKLIEQSMRELNDRHQ